MAVEVVGGWKLGDEQLQGLERTLDHDAVKNAEYTVVYLHHHPWKRGWLWYFLAFNDSRELRRALEGHDISALLFGHRHNAFDDYPKLLPIPRIYDGGSSTGKGGKPALYRVIDLSEDPRKDRAHTFLARRGSRVRRASRYRRRRRARSARSRFMSPVPLADYHRRWNR